MGEESLKLRKKELSKKYNIDFDKLEKGKSTNTMSNFLIIIEYIQKLLHLL